MKKIILILVIPFLLTGCADVKYNLSINDDLSINEEVFISGTTEYFSNFYKNYPKTIVSEWYESSDNKETLDNNFYSHELITEDVAYPGVRISKSYDTINDFAKNTIFKDQIFEDILCITNNNLITIKSVGSYSYTEDETYGYSISKLSINIKVPYVVEEHNADSVNKKTNTYTWIINEETEDKEIKLTFDKDKKYVYNLVMYISLSILIFLGIILIFVIRSFIKKGKKNNRIFD